MKFSEMMCNWPANISCKNGAHRPNGFDKIQKIIGVPLFFNTPYILNLFTKVYDFSVIPTNFFILCDPEKKRSEIPFQFFQRMFIISLASIENFFRLKKN